MKEERHIYMFTPAGWQHLGIGKVVEPGGIPLNAEDVQRLKELYLQEEDAKEVSGDQLPEKKSVKATG